MSDIYFKGKKYVPGKEVLRGLADELGEEYVFIEINGSASLGRCVGDNKRNPTIDTLLAADSSGRIEFHGDVERHFEKNLDQLEKLYQANLLQSIQTIPVPIINTRQPFPGAKRFAYAERMKGSIKKIINGEPLETSDFKPNS